MEYYKSMETVHWSSETEAALSKVLEEYVVDLCMHTDNTLGGVKGFQETSRQKNVNVLSVKQTMHFLFYRYLVWHYSCNKTLNFVILVILTLREMLITRQEVS